MTNTLFPKEIKLKNGEIMLLRETKREDAAALLTFLDTVGGESNFLTFGSGEFGKTIAEQEAFIEACHLAPNRLSIIAEIKGEIAGGLDVEASKQPRLQHACEFGIAIKKIHWGKGIGNILIQSLIEWAKQGGIIRKINLFVNEKNDKAIQLYKKNGFEIEGKLRRDVFLNGQFHDAYLMGLLI